jgi:hydroxymethylbilane synthase
MPTPQGPPVRSIRIGSRGSPLALWQARHVSDRLRAAAPGLRVEIEVIRTRAEKFPEEEPTSIGIGIFTREIDDEQIAGRIDLAVHSLKDIPSDLSPALTIAAIPERESPLDALVGTEAGLRFDALPPGAGIGTGSPRRKAQLLHRRPDLRVVPLRGNVETRLRKSREEGLAGTILAHAGLRRLARDEVIGEVLPAEWFTPAVGQGAIAICARADRQDLIELARLLEHPPTRFAIAAERAFLARLRGGCLVPAGALAQVVDGGSGLKMIGVLASPDGARCIRGTAAGASGEAAEIGRRLAEDLLGRGGREVLGALPRGDAGGPPEAGGPGTIVVASAVPASPAAAAPPERHLAGRTIVITRSEDRNDSFHRSLEELGARVISVPTIRFEPPPDPRPLDEALADLDRFRWIIFTSATGVHFFFQAVRKRGIPIQVFQAKRFAAVGPATATALAEVNVQAERISAAGDALSLAQTLAGPGAADPLGPQDPCLLPQADIARQELPALLQKAGVPVTTVTVYHTLTEDPARAWPFLKLLEGDERIDAIAFASPSAMRSFLAMTHPHGEHAIREKPICVFSIGPTTTAAIRERGLQVAREALPHTQEALVAAIVDELKLMTPPTGIMPDEPP